MIRAWMILLIGGMFAVQALAEVPLRRHCEVPEMPFPIVDMHTHLFNFRYLPMKGILYRFRVPWPLAGVIADALVGATGDMNEVTLVPAVEDLQFEALQNASPVQVEDFFFQRLAAGPGYEKLLRNEDRLNRFLAKQLEVEATNAGITSTGESYNQFFNDYENEIGSTTPMFTPNVNVGLTYEERTALLPMTVKVAAVLPFRNGWETVSGYFRMLSILMMREDEIARYLMEKEYCGVDYFVHYMMDMEIPYKTQTKVAFQDQISRSASLNDMFDGKLIFFGAYDPFRRDDGLGLAQQAQAAGAAGLKFYPPSGYRPGNTMIPGKPALFSKHFPFVHLPFTSYFQIRQQYKARYGGWEDKDIDANIDEFIDYVDKEGLVIFSHHSLEGFEAYDDYGNIFGSPGYWAKTLQGNPKLNKHGHPELRLVIGHAGGGEGWFGEWEGSYAQKAYNLCVLFKNVYCDFGYSNEVFDEKKREIFADRLAKLIVPENKATIEQAEKWRASDLNAPIGDAPWVYPITSKILYGSDWMMVSRLEERRSFVRDFNKVFDLNDLHEHREGFFGGNAIRLLDIPRSH